MVRLNDTELAILAHAQLDADTPVNVLAKALSMREHTVRHALSRMEEAGVISRLLYVDLYRIGFVEYYLFLKLASNTPAEEKKLIDTLSASERVTWIVRVGGNYSIGFAFMARSISECVAFIDEVMERSAVRASERAFLVLAERTYFGVKHLAPLPSGTLPVEMGSVGKEPVEFEEIDHLVLRALAASKSGFAASIAREVGRPESTVQYRLKTLQDRGILRRCVYLVNPETYGRSAYRLRAVIKSPSKSVRDKIYSWSKSHPNILSFLHCLGPWDFEFRVEVADPKEALSIAQNLTETVGDAISHTEIVPTLETKRLLHYPFKNWPLAPGLF